MKQNTQTTLMIERTLHRLGINANYRGYRQLRLAISMVIEDENRLLNAKKELYLPISAQLNCNPETIERNIRTAINRMWNLNQDGYHALVGFKTFKAPVALDFIEALAFHVRSSVAAQIH